jgi:rod shape determining protein RodA
MDRQRFNLLFRLHVDAPLLSFTLLLCGIGLVVLYSASGQELAVVIRQGMRMLLGLGLMLGLAQIPPRHFAHWAPWFYGVGMIFLVACLVAGEGRGADRWLDLKVIRFQPSEMMKIFVPMMAAWYLCDKPVPVGLRHTLIGGALIAAPFMLIAKQPDLGTAALVAGAGASVLFLAGISWRLMGSAALLVMVCAPVLWSLMHDYQRNRILTMLDPEKDPLGTGYHIIQSKIAVGSGGIYGKGWLNGTQSYLEFLPERSTDFIFAVFCEEFGYLGVLVLIAMYILVLWRGLTIAMEAQSMFARLLAGALTLILFIYVFVNTGMVIGQLPVVGVPLPLISYGGTSLVTLMASFGILMSVHTHKKFLS